MNKNPRFPDFSRYNLDPLYLLKLELLSKGVKILDLTESNLTNLDFNFPKEIILHNIMNEYSWNYSPDPRGIPVARQSIAKYYEARLGWEPGYIDLDDIYITSGTSEAYSFLIKTFTRPGDEIVVEVPGYPLTDSIAELELCRILELNLSKIFISNENYSNIDNKEFIEDRRNSIWKGTISTRTKLICLVSPNNPTGKVIDKLVLQEIIHIARVHNIAVIIDEVFYDYSLLPYNPLELNILAKGVDVFLLNGISKAAGLPGWKLGWIYHVSKSEEFKEIQERLLWLGDCFLSTHSISQELLPNIIDSRILIQNQIKKRIQRNLHWLNELLNGRWRFEYGGGGWYASIILDQEKNIKMNYMNIGRLDVSLEIAIRLLEEKGIFVHPGSYYKYPIEDCRLIVSLIVKENEFKDGIIQIVNLLA